MCAVSGKTVLLKSNGFYGTGDVWVNGVRAARVDGSFLGFSLDIGRLLKAGEPNRLAIRLTNDCPDSILPGIREPDFVLFGGLASRVWLEIRDNAHFAQDTLFIRPELEFREGGGASGGASGRCHGRIHVAAKIENAGDAPCDVRLRVTVRDTATGQVVAQRDGETISVPPSASPAPVQEHALTLEIPEAKLWDTDSPQLYEVECALLKNGAAPASASAPIDTLARRTGFRAAEFRPGAGFYLNGRRVFLRGCNRHESMPGYGNALPDALHRADARLIRDAGLNFVRLSHYPQNPAFLDACDELGILVYAELASWKSVRGGAWLRNAERQFGGMIRRDHARPSFIIWGMGNEARDLAAYQRLKALAAALDPLRRPVTYAENHLYRARRKRTIGLPDVWGCNYELTPAALEEGRDASQLRNVLVSECSNAPHAERGDLDAEREQLAQLERDLPPLETLPYAAGFALWCYNDYATMRKNRHYRHCGILDAWREPKMSYYWLRARYAAAPFVKLFANWSEDTAKHGALRRLEIFTSIDETLLTLNGKEVATFHGKGRHTLELAFEPGQLKLAPADAAIAVDIADELHSWGEARALILEKAPPATPSEQVFTLRVLDASGHQVRDWTGEVSVMTAGACEARPYSPSKIRVTGGSARIYFTALPPSAASADWQFIATAPSLATATYAAPSGVIEKC